MKAIQKQKDNSVLLIHDDCIKTGRLRDTYDEYGEKLGGQLANDYTFDNKSCVCLSDAMRDYKFESETAYVYVDWNNVDIQVAGPETVIIKNKNGERQTEVETFFNNWAKNNVRYTECRYITYKFANNYNSILIEIKSNDPFFPIIYRELNNSDAQKYIDIYNRAEFPNEWRDHMKVCHVDDYQLVKVNDVFEFEYASIRKINERKSV